MFKTTTSGVPSQQSGEAPQEQMREVVSTVVRFHDPAGLGKLERAIQSLHAQAGAIVQPIVVTQRFDKRALQRTRDAVLRQWFFDWLPEPAVENYEDDSQGDARSALMNLGIERHCALRNRFLAFLDYDDLLYSHAYRTLMRPLLDSDVAVAFASVEMGHAVGLHDYDFVYDMSYPFLGRNKIDLIRDNFCPLHSYLVDCAKVEAKELHFRSELSRVEDYDFLLRVAGARPCDFSGIGRRIGVYLMRSDDSNSTPSHDGSACDQEKKSIWKCNRDRLDRLRSGYPVKFFASDF
ncbi:hypothetical protein [Lysobacter enzymogenes]|uniref:Glycosyltransferase family 2 protein n=1 Tax=Lysobacter enzymogenes TaxID=69 RepID=A0A3N2RJ65_LYSEN|nr:hypothetical protein [Lysobacter enzymogenes]ROU07439.1 hypothetical protein D9T17_09040 [Lysobacter enzymogenes]